ncbi:MAG: DUF4160 domain-containing protein [Tunicatimonas sp.]
MPKIYEQNGYRFFFYSAEGDEPCHVHIKKGEGDGKIWLEPELREEYLVDFKIQEKKQIRKIVQEQRDYFIQRWHEYFEDNN